MDKKEILDRINQMNQNTMMEWMDIRFIDFTGDMLIAEMTVNEKVHQPYGLLHGGASAALAETVGSVLSAIQFPGSDHGAVGTNLNIYHLKSARDGKVIAKGSFIRKGKGQHVVKIDIFDEQDNHISHAILTNQIINRTKKYQK
ncbi:hotdog fold thioesterase [Flavobacteriaceae bacterium Ap0902]|nr:hotdog fold thioesterase [Flavobacteriaceae bacterium Ap0902]